MKGVRPAAVGCDNPLRAHESITQAASIRNAAECLAAQPGEIERPRDTAMRRQRHSLIACYGPLQPLRPDFGTQGRPCAATHSAIRLAMDVPVTKMPLSVRKTKQLARPESHLPLHLQRNLVPPAQVGVEAAANISASYLPTAVPAKCTNP